MLTRRDFISKATATLVLVPVAAACGSSSSSSGNTGSCNGVGATSSSVQGHTHTVCVPESDLANPPSGGMTYTTSGPDPTHQITLSADQLSTINRGGSVTVTTSSNGGHTHDFALARGSS